MGWEIPVILTCEGIVVQGGGSLLQGLVQLGTLIRKRLGS